MSENKPQTIRVQLDVRVAVTDPVALSVYNTTMIDDVATGELSLMEIGEGDQRVAAAVSRLLYEAFYNRGEHVGLEYHGASGTVLGPDDDVVP